MTPWINSIAAGATAQLRTVLNEADREDARRIYDELMRMAAVLGRKHGFAKAQKTDCTKQRVVV